ncbi:hypothetical protein [Paenibacillus sp. HB172176]|uniref:hypothetical protein n=1 Tax=Paenibacillus sp. HB172176 TaxID=2493690 RepID=UPI00143CBF23|nr:hypothetical protein [Paenibacillus sp. HB172176]
MISLQNEYMALTCSEDGENLILHDLTRGTKWEWDEKSLIAHHSVDDETVSQLVPVKAQISNEAGLSITYKAFSESLRVDYLLKTDYIEVTTDITEGSEIVSLSLPGSFKAENGRTDYVLPIMQGMLWKGKGEPFDWRLLEGGHRRFTMPLVGFLAASSGLLVTVETRDDLTLWVGKELHGRCWATFMQEASLGSMRYKRAVRLYLTDGTHTAVAKRYRQKVMDEGRFKSWTEKISERPALESLFGTLMCFIGYCEDDLDYVSECSKLKEAGFDKALIYPARFSTYHRDFQMGGLPPIHLDAQQTEEIKKLGFDVAPWSWINEAMDDGTSSIQSKYRLSATGSYVPSWSMDGQVWNQICTSGMADYQRAASQGLLADMTWDHFDVITCATLGECYALEHEGHSGRALSRSEDRQFIRKLLESGQAGGRAVSSEGFNDNYADVYDMGSVKALPMFRHWPFWPIPLTMLIYHDSMIHTWWEMHSYNNHRFGRVQENDMFESGGGRPRLQAAMDALYGTPPDVFPFGTQYMWTGKGNDTFAYKFRFEDPAVQEALREALPVAKLHERIGKLEMVDHRILSEDGNVQESVFADGTRIIANFAGDLRSNLPGIEPIQAESWRIES